MRIALIHDFLIQDGGAERVLKAFQEIFPQAPIFVLVYNKNKAGALFSQKDVQPSFLQRLPWGVRHYQWYLPLMPLAVERFRLSDFDLVISSSSAFAKGVLTPPETLHLCYCHTPTRYLWTDSHSYVSELSYPFFVKMVIPFALTRLRLWDRMASDRVDGFVANSQNVARRILKYYRRPSDIIHPPVEVGQFSLGSPKNYYLAGGRLVSYKRFDLLIQAFNKLGIPLKIFGEGPAEQSLRAMAKKNIEFLGKVSDHERAKLYRESLAFLHPQVEDFGITPIESMASGRPVIAYGVGGALETVVPGKTGLFFPEQTWECLANTIIHFQPEAFDPQIVRAHALQFSKEAFQEKFKKYLGEKWEKFSR